MSKNTNKPKKQKQTTEYKQTLKEARSFSPRTETLKHSMIRSLHAWMGFVLVFCGRGLLLWFLDWLPLLEMYLEGQGWRDGCNGSVLHLTAIFSWEGSLCPHRCAVNHTFCVPDFFQISAFTSSVSKLSVCLVALPSWVLPQVWLSFKPPTSEPLNLGPHSSLSVRV